MESEENELQNLNDVALDMEGEESDDELVWDSKNIDGFDFVETEDYKKFVTVGDNPNSLFFADNKKKIDFVLVYEDSDEEKVKDEEWRMYFEYNLMHSLGLELEYTKSVSDDDNLVYVKVHLPSKVLSFFAEVLHIKLEIKQPKTSSSKDQAKENPTREDQPGEDPSSNDPVQQEEQGPRSRNDLVCKPRNTCFRPFTAPFQIKREDHFHIDFTPSMRSRMADYILSRTPYAPRKFGISTLLAKGIYKAAYPLHDSSLIKPKQDEERKGAKGTERKEKDYPNDRRKLYNEWAHPKNIFKSFYKRQPLDDIRRYYGEKIGMYFAWLEFYIKMLFLASIAGIGCFVYGYKTRETTTWIKEVCDPEIGGTIVMCPQCDKCTYWRFNSTCESSKVLSIFDNYGTVVFVGFMTIWVTVFLEFWKRYQATLEYEWDAVEFQETEQPRSEYLATKKKKPYTAYGQIGQCLRASVGIGAVLLWVLLILASVVSIIVYRLAVFSVFSATRSGFVKSISRWMQIELTPQMCTSITASILNFAVIMIINKQYERVAKRITQYENPRTKTDYENSLILKMYLFQFVNYYSSCFYIAFVKGKAVGYPGRPVYILGKFRNEECNPGGCLMELTIQMAVIMGGKAVLNNIQEILTYIPLLHMWRKKLRCRCKKKEEGKEENSNSLLESCSHVPRWEHDYQLDPFPEMGLLAEYMELVIQFGFVTLFVASFPLAPVLALVNNLFEIRIDAWKITTQWYRMVPGKAQNIGAWLPILQAIAVISVVTNAVIIAFTSDMIPRLVYYWSFSVYLYGDHSDHTMAGYINNTMSVFDIRDFTNQSRPSNTPDWFSNITTCRYKDYRFPPGHTSGREYEYSYYYWHVIAARLAFIVVVEHIAYLTEFVLGYAIPDVPKAIKKVIKQEQELTQKILYKADYSQFKRKYEASH